MTSLSQLENEFESKYYDKLPPYYNLKSTSDNTLLFESRFESGNLAKAY